jgi:hypothetical protein
MKSKKLYPENITKSFRRFNGDLSIQINNKRWIDLKPSEEMGPQVIDDFLKARNTGRLEYIEVNENKEIVELKIDKYKNANKDIVDQVRKIYRHS